MRPLLSIAINSYRNPELLKLCLDSVLRSIEHSKLSAEIIVADSATEEATEMLIREEYPQVIFLPHKENVGFGALVNASLRAYHGDYLVLLNADIVMRDDALLQAIEYLKTHPAVGLLGLKQLNFNGSLQPTCLRYYRPSTILYRRTWFQYLPWAKRHLDWFTMAEYDHATPKAVDWVMGSAMIGKREAIEAVGPMDKQFFLYMEDVDWCRRFWEAGYQVVYFPFASVYHYHAKGSARGGFFRSLLFNRLTWYHIESAVKYFWKYRYKPLPTSEDRSTVKIEK